MELVTHYQPHFKPDFNLDYLRTNNYICHLFTVRKRDDKTAGGFRKEYDGAQDYDFILRCTEVAARLCTYLKYYTTGECIQVPLPGIRKVRFVMPTRPEEGRWIPFEPSQHKGTGGARRPLGALPYPLRADRHTAGFHYHCTGYF